MDYIIENNELIECYEAFDTMIDLPNNITKICAASFYGLDNIETIYMHDKVRTIEEMICQGCVNLNYIYLSKNLKRIGNFAFAQCKSLKELTIPSGVRSIEISTFEDCESLEKIILPNKIIRISDKAFFNCGSLENIKLPNSLTYIGANAFHHCSKLKNIEIPEKIKVINDGTFSECHQLEKIKLHDDITQINDLSFYFCVSLEDITLPSNLIKIGSCAFANCYSLEHITIPASVKTIEEGAFSECQNLNELILNEGLEKISSFAFFYCKRLFNLTIPNTVKTIDSQAFSSCTNLEEIVIPSSVTKMGENVFDNCPRLNKITLENINLLKNKALDYNLESMDYIYVNPTNHKFVLSKTELNLSSEYNKLDIQQINKLTKTYGYTKAEAILLINKIPRDSYDDFIHLKYILPKLLEYYDLNDDEYLNLMNHDHLNFLLKRIKRLASDIEIEEAEEIYKISKFAMSLGVLDKKKSIRQKASEFIATSLQKGTLDIYRVHDIFNNFHPITTDKDFNKDWADFIMHKDNFAQLLRLEEKEPGFICYIYQNFSNIKEFGRKSNGKQQYRKVTLSMCVDFHNKIYFAGANNDNIDIANELSKYSDTKKQKYFDDAIKIRQEYEKLKQKGMIRSHILSVPLVEPDIFTQIEKERTAVFANLKDVHHSLDKIANKRFTYELLSKEDPKNFTLGKYCACCAHIAGVGYGIMKASILHPTCQNMVLKDTEGKIVAKSTIYVNTEQGYAVCNTISVSESAYDKVTLDMLYQKFLVAINEFALQYNEENPQKPIKQINAGANYNVFYQRLKDDGRKAKTILEGLHFSQYGIVGQNHNDDWLDDQYIVWKDTKNGGKKNGRP